MYSMPQMSRPAKRAPTLSTLERTLGFRDLVVYGLAYIAPMGPLATLGFVWSESRGLIALAYLLGGLCMSFTAKSYAEMTAAVPSAGSVYGFARHALGPFPGFVAGWMILLDYLLIPSFLFVTVALAFGSLVPTVDHAVWIVALVGFTTGARPRVDDPDCRGILECAADAGRRRARAVCDGTGSPDSACIRPRASQAPHPYVGMLFAAAVSLVVALTMRNVADDLAAIVNFGALSGFLLLHLCVLAHFGWNQQSRRWFAHWLVPVAGIGVVLGVFSGMSRLALQLGGTWLAIGCVYGFVLRTRARVDLPGL